VSGPLELHGERVVLREAAPGDADAFAEVLAAPEVERWWGPHTREQVVEELFGDAETTAFAVVVDGAVRGLVTYAEEEDPDYRHAAIDVALHPAAIGRGLGADAVRTLARYLLDERGHHRLTIDPAAANERAIRCYERVGFRPVGVMRRYERVADGDWHDGLLMDLLAGELR
jgi:aminoglycoside 6'-N-acetyltransferase